MTVQSLSINKFKSVMKLKKKGISLKKIGGKTKRKRRRITRRRIKRKQKGIKSKMTSCTQDLLMKKMVTALKLRRKAK